MNMNLVGLVLSAVWILVLFVGAILSKSQKSELIKGITIGALVAIPVTYIITWMFQPELTSCLKAASKEISNPERTADRCWKALR